MTKKGFSKKRIYFYNAYLYVCLSINLKACIFKASIYLYVCMYVYVSVYVFSVYLYVFLSVYLFVVLSVKYACPVDSNHRHLRLQE